MTERRARLLGPLFALSWLGILALYVQDLLRPLGQIKNRMEFVPLLVIFVILYAAFWTWGLYRDTRLKAILVGSMVVVNTALVALGGSSTGAIFTYTVVVVGAAFAWRVSLGLVIVLAVGILAGDYGFTHDWVMSGSVALQELLFGLAAVGISALIRTVIELRQARDELARLAVSEERLRFARDLHDLLGHSLSVVVLKAELAQGLMARDPERAAGEIREVERVARDALRDVREAVAGYRKTNLATELSGAREMLESAGISCLLHEDAGPLPVETETALAWAVREGATNVLRHSGARECTVRITRRAGHALLEIRDDGQGANGSEEGNGLRGLGERVKAVGGRVHIGSADGTGFRLLVSVPT